jgi:hypothetical protein
VALAQERQAVPLAQERQAVPQVLLAALFFVAVHLQPQEEQPVGPETIRRDSVASSAAPVAPQERAEREQWVRSAFRPQWVSPRLLWLGAPYLPKQTAGGSAPKSSAAATEWSSAGRVARVRRRLQRATAGAWLHQDRCSWRGWPCY